MRNCVQARCININRIHKKENNMLEMIQSFIAGTAVSLSIGSPAEWAVHKYMLHASPRARRRVPFIEGSARGHNDIHHKAYNGPEHYYRDVTNEHEIIHFSPSDVGIIAAASAVVGAAIDRAIALAANAPEFKAENASFVAGAVAGTLAYYGVYEFTHHYMHVIGERRLAINRVLGDTIQGGQRDGMLRFSKPLLDDICNTVEAHIDYVGEHRENRTLKGAVAPRASKLQEQNVLEASETSFPKKREPHRFFDPYHFSDSDSSLISRLNKQIEDNSQLPMKKRPKLAYKHQEGAAVLERTEIAMAEREQEYRRDLTLSESFRYTISRRIQRTLRVSPLFQRLDNHHFLHHRHYGKNLNVALPLMDYLAGTKADSSFSALEENKSYWLCPNSPDTAKFERAQVHKKREILRAA